MSDTEIPKLISASELAARLGVSRHTLSKLTDKGVMPTPLDLGAGNSRKYEHYSEPEVLAAVEQLALRYRGGGHE